MKCQYCGYEESKVIDSRSAEECNGIKRRRECLGCGKRFTTYERIDTFQILVVKKDGSRQPFNIQKIKNGLIKACEKRPVTMKQIDEISWSIERDLQNNLDTEVASQQIGEMVMEKLKEVDEVAYVRFASVYRQFTDITNFMNFLSSFDKNVTMDKNGKKEK